MSGWRGHEGGVILGRLSLGGTPTLPCHPTMYVFVALGLLARTRRMHLDACSAPRVGVKLTIFNRSASKKTESC